MTTLIWRAPSVFTAKDRGPDFLKALPSAWPCPKCGKDARCSVHYSFSRDDLAFSCPECGLFVHNIS